MVVSPPLYCFYHVFDALSCILKVKLEPDHDLVKIVGEILDLNSQYVNNTFP